MTSCAEATFFLKNCPGTKMDGNNDGIGPQKGRRRHRARLELVAGWAAPDPVTSCPTAAVHGEFSQFRSLTDSYRGW